MLQNRTYYVLPTPIEARDYVRTNMQRELDVILNALEEAETIVSESIEDSADILDMETAPPVSN